MLGGGGGERGLAGDREVYVGPSHSHSGPFPFFLDNLSLHTHSRPAKNKNERNQLPSLPPFIFVVLGSKPYNSLTVGVFFAHTFHTGDSLFTVLGMWASYSPRQSPGMLAAQSLTMAPETKHPSSKRHRTDNAAYNQCQLKEKDKKRHTHIKRHVLGIYLYSAGSQHGNLHQLSVTICRMTWWWLFPRLRGFWENVQFIPRLHFFFFFLSGN